MILFTGQRLNGWRVWGLWFKHKYFIGVSVVRVVKGDNQ